MVFAFAALGSILFLITAGFVGLCHKLKED
jgi:hypothetical protein